MAKSETLTPRTIEIIFNGGEKKRIGNIPGNAKITYGPISPGAHGDRNTNALRIYTSESNQLAVFVGVKEFRDLSLNVQTEKVVKSSSSEDIRGKGVRTSSEVEVSRSWE